MEGGGEYKDCFQNSLFQPRLTKPFLLRILGVPQRMKSRLSLLWQGPPQNRFAPDLSHHTYLMLAVPVLWPGQHVRAGGQAWRGWGGVRPGPVRRTPSLTSQVVSLLSVSVLTNLHKFPEWEEKGAFRGQTGDSFWLLTLGKILGIRPPNVCLLNWFLNHEVFWAF